MPTHINAWDERSFLMVIMGMKLNMGAINIKLGWKQEVALVELWELSGIPYPHAVCAIFDKGGDPEDYIDPCYSKEVYQGIYSHHLQPMNGELMWSRTQHNDIAPPIPRKT
ncbi:unnamed protein product, partial [Cuscuta europaea]